MSLVTDKNFRELKERGYTVVPRVVSHEDCDKTVSQYKAWLSQFGEDNWPYAFNSLLRSYNTAHMEPTWSIRIKAKPVFAQVWKTEKLLTSLDCIAVGRPPEDGKEEFYKPGRHWLHLDQCVPRIGLHAYQGAVYLEEACEDDWTLQVIESSHKHFEDFFAENPAAQRKSQAEYGYYDLEEPDVEFMLKRGCAVRRVPVPKGGMVLWDSRLVHANSPPIRGRQHPGRWRHCVFVSMTPAIWATESDLQRKRKAYNEVSTTGHWSSQDIRIFPQDNHTSLSTSIDYPKALPAIARTREAMRLAGVSPYDFNDGSPNADWVPVWKDGREPEQGGKLWTVHGILVWSAILVGVACVIGYSVRRSK